MTVKLERIWFYAGLISLISVIGILIVFSDRGLGFPDEGLHALLIMIFCLNIYTILLLSLSIYFNYDYFVYHWLF
jgi:hypothetical protein